MTYSTGLRSAVCFTALVAGGAAQADVTAAEVWEDWKSQMALYGENGFSVGAEETSGGTLIARDVAISMDDGEVAVSANMGDITLEEQGNGSVRVTMAESYPIVITGNDGTVITVLVSQSDLEMIVSGDANEMNYAVSADSYTIALQDIVDGDVTFTGDVQMVINDLSGDYVSTAGDLRNLNYTLDVASIDLLVDIDVPGAAGEYVTASGKIEGMSMQGDMVVPANADFENPDNIFVEGLSFKGGYTVERANYVFDIDADGDQASGTISTGATTLQGEMNSETIAYDAQTNDLALSINTSEFPFPIEVGLAEYGAGFEMPVGKSDEPADFGLSLDFVDLTINDMIWNMFDGGNVLPRDPATVQFALAGKVKPLFDLLDPAQQSAMNRSDMPFELDSVTLSNLKIALAGALVTGEGEFTFDNSDMNSFAPLPRPEGDAIVEVSGLNGLMDNLVAMGLVPEDQIMGGRMMLGMFARTTGDDRLESKLEVNAEGHVLVNGQRIR